MNKGIICDLEYNDWSEFKHDYLSDVFQDDEHALEKWIFRGQNSSQWELISSFDRLYGNRQNKSKFETMMLNRFKELIDRNFSLKELTKGYTETQILALAQHYGMPTRLLDWSKSPYVAAFFAFSKLQNSEDDRFVTIFALNTSHDAIESCIGCEVIYDVIKENERQQRQSGVFTRQKHTQNTVEGFLKSYNGSDKSVALYKARIPLEERKKAIQDFSLMGISYSSLFSGFESFCMEAELMVQFDCI
jgi:hypothetical protein